MKVIDLLNKIANGEAPRKIRYGEIEYTYDSYRCDIGYVDKSYPPYKWFINEIKDLDTTEVLNDEIEIIDDKLEKRCEKQDI